MSSLLETKSRKLNRQHFIYKTIKPVRQRLILIPITWLLSIPCAIYHRLKINKKNMKGLKPPLHFIIHAYGIRRFQGYDHGHYAVSG